MNEVILPHTKWGRAGAAKGETTYDYEQIHSFNFSWGLVLLLWIVIPAAIVWKVAEFNSYPLDGSVQQMAITVGLWFATALVTLFPIMGICLTMHSRMCVQSHALDQSLLIFNDADFEATWKGQHIPIDDLYHAFFLEKVSFKGDLLEALYTRHNYAKFILTMDHVKFFLLSFIPELLNHSKVQDFTQVTDHYDRGNDFYAAFLGEAMVYTSGKFRTPEDSLMTAQYNKLDDVFGKINLKKGDHLLDIGCGWGTLSRYAGSKGVDATGVTLAKEQTEFANGRIKEDGVEKNARILCMDYRDIPEATNNKKYDKITCLEMAEHVGVKLFQSFLLQVKDMLKDDGVFYLQIAGLRRAWQYEDLLWGLFMARYVFPGADASMPIGWVINQCEQAGFEVRLMETIGVHYSATIKRWYDNWLSNKEHIINEYGTNYYRRWEWFLAWSTIIPEQGSASCYQIVLTKNTSAFDRKNFYLETYGK